MTDLRRNALLIFGFADQMFVASSGDEPLH